MRHAVIVLAAVSCLSVFALAQTAEELVNKNIEAKGGIDKIKAIHSIRMTGKLNAGGGFTASQGQENQRPNLVRETVLAAGDDGRDRVRWRDRLADSALRRPQGSRIDGRRRLEGSAARRGL